MITSKYKATLTRKIYNYEKHTSSTYKIIFSNHALKDGSFIQYNHD